MIKILLLLIPCFSQAQMLNQKVFGNNEIRIDTGTITSVFVPAQRTKAERQKYYQTTSDHLISGLGQTPILLFVNLSTNTVTAYFDQIDMNSIETSVASHFHLYRSPVIISSGTALVINKGNTNSPSSKMQVYMSPTVSSNGVVNFMFTANTQMTIKQFNQAFMVDPGGNVLISVSNNSANRETAVGISWVEE